MTAAPVHHAAQAPDAVLLEAARLMLAVGRHEGIDWVDAQGPPEGCAALLRAGLEPGHEVLLAVDPGRGVALAELPTDSNPSRASVEAYVLPGHRRRGVGRALLAAVARAAVSRGRTIAQITWPVGGTGEAAATALTAVREVHLDRQSVWESGPDTLRTAAQARDEALARAGDYDVRAWLGPCPPDLVDSLGEALAAMDDAPTGDSTWEHPPKGPDAVRRRDRFVADAGLHHHTVVAVHRADGRVAGFTDIVVWPGHDRGEQWDTGVVREHRGHRLGLLVKAEMALRLAEVEPRLRWLHTWNADANSHMLAVNERLGWRPERLWVEAEGPLTALVAELEGSQPVEA